MPAADPGFHCCEDAGHDRDCYLRQRAEKAEAENARLREALEDVCRADCCGCSVYEKIARAALGAPRSTSVPPK